MCPNNYLTCFNHRCVSTKVKCNGFDDCGDLTDEIYGCDVSQCNSTTEFTCASKQCIPLAEVCDGKYIYNMVFMLLCFFHLILQISSIIQQHIAVIYVIKPYNCSCKACW